YAVKFYTVCFAHPSVMAVTWWDLCDTGAWLPGGGMLRADLMPKPVYTALKKLITQDWHTSVAGKADAAGKLAFRGFHGTYKLTATAAGRSAEAEIHLAKGAENQFTIQLQYLPGDANGDGVVNILDLLFIRNNLNRDLNLYPNARRADVNGDGAVNILDLIYGRDRFPR
ncbi:MAG TPA: dockerin type I domain-containing protein, partial [Phycisphaerae bacterium]|nr:dockerin type I domain-containing protein [Phycisphaerae bacterium]